MIPPFLIVIALPKLALVIPDDAADGASRRASASCNAALGEQRCQTTTDGAAYHASIFDESAKIQLATLDM
jgi:hypothetical protein